MSRLRQKMTTRRRGSVPRRASALWRAVLAVASVALIASACSSAHGKSGDGDSGGGTLRLGTQAPINTMNPFITQNTEAYCSFTLMYPFLVQYNLKTKQPEADFATKWSHSSDGLTWTFTVRSGTKWSDGKPLTVQDAAWTLNTIVKFQDGPTAQNATNVTDLVKAVATSDTELTLTYSKPVANVLANMAELPILPEHIWASAAAGNGSKLRKFVNLPGSSGPVVSGGPFIFTKYVQNQVALFARNPNWYGEKPKIDGFGLEYFTDSDAELEALKSGQIDAALGNPALPPTAVKPLATKFNVINAPDTSFQDIIINSTPTMTAHRELLDPKVREAMDDATDRATIDKVAYLGYAVLGGPLVPPASGSWSDPDVKAPAFDLDRANQLLDSAGYAKGADGIRVANGQPMSYKFVIATDNGGAGVRAGQIMKNDFQKIGIKLTLKIADSTTMNNVLYGNHYRDYQLAMWGWNAYIDPNYILSVMTCKQLNALNDNGYCNKAYDALFDKQAETIDPAARQKIVYQMQEIIAKDRPYLILNYENILEAWSKDWCGIVTSPLGFYNYFSKDAMDQVHRCS